MKTYRVNFKLLLIVLFLVIHLPQILAYSGEIAFVGASNVDEMTYLIRVS